MLEYMVNLVAADAAFNAWLSCEVRGADKDMMILLFFYDKVESDVMRALSELCAKGDNAAFICRIKDAISRLVNIKNANIIDI